MLLVGAACYTSFVLWGSRSSSQTVFLGATARELDHQGSAEDNSADEINAPKTTSNTSSFKVIGLLQPNLGRELACQLKADLHAQALLKRLHSGEGATSPLSRLTRATRLQGSASADIPVKNVARFIDPTSPESGNLGGNERPSLLMPANRRGWLSPGPYRLY